MYRILIAAAVVPAAVLLLYVYRQDRLEREPVGLLFKLLGFGALSALPSIVTERLGTGLLDRSFPGYTWGYLFLLYYVVVALSEEGFKFLFLNLGSWKKPSFDCQFDGVVYAVFVSLGFAIFENIGYVVQNGFTTALLRAVTAIPGHACFGVFMGSWYGLAKRCQLRGLRSQATACRIMAVLVPVLLHGTYDFIATIDNTAYSLIFIGFILLLFPISFITVKRAAKRDRYIA